MPEDHEETPPADHPTEPTERGTSLRLFGIVSISLLVILLLVFVATR